MTTSFDKTIALLNDLIAIGQDARQGFDTAAGATTDPELARVFRDYAVQRADFVTALKERVRTLRATPDQRGDLAGALHRGWMNLQSALATAESHAVLAECERGEDIAVKAYAAALGDRDLDAETRRLVQGQYESVQAAHDRIHQLRDSATYAHR
jgi:uncharacterized protein (TIGR02284 family)